MNPSPQYSSAPVDQVGDVFEISEALQPLRQDRHRWPTFQGTLEALRMPEPGPELAGDQHLAQEYLRVYQVTKDKLLDAVPGFGHVGKTETHCFFSPQGAKHLVSRLIDKPHLRVTELTLFPNGDIMRLFYEKVAGPEQELEDLYEFGMVDLQNDHARFARYPGYELGFFMLTVSEGTLTEALKGRCAYDPVSGEPVFWEEEE